MLAARDSERFVSERLVAARCLPSRSRVPQHPVHFSRKFAIGRLNPD